MTNRWSGVCRIHLANIMTRPIRLPSRGVTRCPGSACFSASLAYRLRFVHIFFDALLGLSGASPYQHS